MANEHYHVGWYSRENHGHSCTGVNGVEANFIRVESQTLVVKLRGPKAQASECQGCREVVKPRTGGIGVNGSGTTSAGKTRMQHMMEAP